MDQREKIRNQIREARRRLTPEFAVNLSGAIQRHALDLETWYSSKTVCCYLAMPQEVQTDMIVRRCHAEKKRLFVPAYMKTKRKYMPALYERNGETQAGQYNIRAPVSPQWIKSEKIDIVFVPGLAFDRRGGRLGHGCGYYDDLLHEESLREAFKAGLAFEFQIFDNIPLHPDDVCMDVVITEMGIYRC
jgi:5-formyltetrahydrofolate cyclo-ligase